MLIRPLLFIVIWFLGLLSFGAIASAQERDLPEEVRALAVVCSSGASVEFRGQIEGGINRLFGKVLAGQGELEVSKSETDFLSSFENENLRLEARSVYNDCVLGALQIIYNLKHDQALKSSDSRLLVPDSLTLIRSGERFALRTRDAIGLEGGGIISVYEAIKNCGKPRVRISNSGRISNALIDLSDNLAIPDRTNCWITLYGIRSFSDKETCVYSFLYQCK